VLGRLSLAALALAAACNGGKARPTPDPPVARCDEVRAHVEQLYRSAIAEPAADEIEANVHMVLADCRTDPGRFAPCVRAAQTVAQLEAQCVIPLDDEGRVEGAAFR
jgi:hypothetical protein